MKNRAISITIGLAGTLLLASLILVFSFRAFKDDYDLESELVSLVKEYYENDFKPVNEKFLSSNGLLVVDLEILESMKKDITHFKVKSCDYTDTYATISYDETDEYTIETHLECKK